MRQYLEVLGRCALFGGIESEQLLTLLECLGAVCQSYRKSDFVLRAGSPPKRVGVVLSGGVHVVQEDYWGNRSIVNHCVPGDLFAESFCCAGSEQLPVSVVATEASTVLFLDFGRIINVCSSACGFHNGLIQNMLRVLAAKSVALTQKLEDVSQRNTRKKLLSYLSRQALDFGAAAAATGRDSSAGAGGAAGETAASRAANGGKGRPFVIPYDRQELADYLSVDRSALSAELSRMAKEGLLRYDRNRFELL